jgi:hypothetical protein
MKLSDRGGSNVFGRYQNVSEQGVKSLWAVEGWDSGNGCGAKSETIAVLGKEEKVGAGYSLLKPY